MNGNCTSEILTCVATAHAGHIPAKNQSKPLRHHINFRYHRARGDGSFSLNINNQLLSLEVEWCDGIIHVQAN